MIAGTRRILSFVALAALPSLCPAAEDLTIVYALKTGDTSTMYLTSERTRATTADVDTISEFATGRIVSINHKKKEYTETTAAEMQAFSEKTLAGLEAMPTFARKAMGAEVGAISVRKGTATRQIAGYDCTQYTLSMGDDVVIDMWVAPALEMPTQVIDAEKARYAAMGPSGRRALAMLDERKKIKGAPLAIGMNMKVVGMKIDSLMEATEVRRGPIPADTFAIPAGYKKKDSPFKR